ncbi:hypothetical protein Ancab_023560 [Ancistrocladus abbreviatus]
MATGTNMGMLSEMNVGTSLVDDAARGQNGTLEDSLMSEIELLLQEQHHNHGITDCERDLNIYRSGSAPPTIEGSINAMGSLFGSSWFGSISNGNSNSNRGLSEDEMRSHPAYPSYYYAHDNINPRLPPPLMSKEEWRMRQRFRGDGSSLEGVADRRKRVLADDVDNSSLFLIQPGLSMQKKENGFLGPSVAGSTNLSLQASTEWLDGRGGLVGLAGTGMGARRKSFADILQEGLDGPAFLSGPVSRPASCNAFSDIVDKSGNSDIHSAELSNILEAKEGFHSGSRAGLFRVQSHSSMVSHTFPIAVGSSLSRSSTPEILLAGRSSSPSIPSVSRVSPVEMNNIARSYATSGHSSNMSDFASHLTGLHLTENVLADEHGHVWSQFRPGLASQAAFLSNMSEGLKQQLIDESTAENTNYPDLLWKERVLKDQNVSNSSFPKRTTASANLFSEANLLGCGELKGSFSLYRNANFSAIPGHPLAQHSVNQKLKSGINNHLVADSQSSNRSGKHILPEHHLPAKDMYYLRPLNRTSDATYAPAGQSHSLGPNYVDVSHFKLLGSQKAHLEALLAQQEQFDLPFLAKPHGLNHGYYRSPAHELGMQHQEAVVANALRTGGSVNALLQSDHLLRLSSMMGSSMGGSIASWHPDIGTSMEGRIGSTLLEEFKNNKTMSFELPDIVDHVVEFSMDQCGSRFIQQKLETATDEEKMKIFPEIISHARTLMTDVFGNYVIQKLFEYGTESQRKELTNQLTGHVLPLSLQMYGCRVIQKALEVVDVEEKTQMVGELDGSVMKCVRDQNGNHVIQKCIECVPQDRIQFIISAFFGHIFALSTHPYGCRVIQRVLEHCHDSDTQKSIMDEIMQSVCILAQDQYGNYVIQHVLQHGDPKERSAIISKLAGQIVKMSQQKFASNVIEKCLTFGSPEERQLLVNEMLGSTDENEPLQAMMKDPFGNYVVQKVIETSDDQTREFIISRIKVHLNALKRYTYGKHIVARVEKLLTAGERRIGLPA